MGGSTCSGPAVASPLFGEARCALKMIGEVPYELHNWNAARVSPRYGLVKRNRAKQQNTRGTLAANNTTTSVTVGAERSTFAIGAYPVVVVRGR